MSRLGLEPCILNFPITNKKPTKCWGHVKRRNAAPLTETYLQAILNVISYNLASNVAELFNRLLAFVQYSVTFYSRQEAAIDVISGDTIDKVGVGINVKFDYSRLNHY